jgi:hypothetical protein
VNEIYPDDWSSFNMLLDREHEENMKFIERHSSIMGMPKSRPTHCYGYVIDKHNSGIIRSEIEFSLMHSQPFDWANLQARLINHSNILREFDANQ